MCTGGGVRAQGVALAPAVLVVWANKQTQLQYDNSITVLQYYSITALQNYSITVLQYYSITVLQYYSITVLQLCTANEGSVRI